MTAPVSQPSDVVSFGPFNLIARERLLTKDGAPVQLGARAFDILLALISRPNQPVGKAELLAEVWPDILVGEGSLHVQIAGLRKTLGDGQDGARYIATLTGRGYCFVAPVSRSAVKTTPSAASVPEAQFLPPRSTRMVGREDGVLKLSSVLATSRFVTIVGPGGVGKTTLAVAVAHDLKAAFAGAVLFVDLSLLNDPRMVAMSLVSMLGLSVQSDDPTPSLIAYLRDKRLLLILDNCEHVIEAAANLATFIFFRASQLHILATSREALRIEGEHVYKLDSLACPPDDGQLTAALARSFPAVELFLERAEANGVHLDLSDQDAAIIADLCRKLDGIPLAIELAAGRVAYYGLRQMAALLDRHLSLLGQGRRSAPARQQTLRATLDWSFALLSEPERTVLRRLAVFVGTFSLDGALAVVGGADVDEALVFGTIDSLIAKSMVVVRPLGAMMRYRLLDTTRAYVLEIRTDRAERARLAARHAAYYRQRVEQEGGEWSSVSNAAERAHYLADLSNVSTALEWCLGPEGDTKLGIGLAAAAVSVFWGMSLPADCVRWAERAISVLGDTTRGGRDEIRLQAILGVSLMFTRGLTDVTRKAIDRSLEIADEHGDDLDHYLPLGALYTYHLYVGDCGRALQYARRAWAGTKTSQDSGAVALARYGLGLLLHYVGDIAGAGVELDAALELPPASQSTGRKTYLGNNHDIAASGTLARNLWLQGYPVQALERSRRNLDEAGSIDLPVPVAIALNLALTVCLWAGDLKSAREYNARYLSLAQAHLAMELDLAMSGGVDGHIALLEGDARGAIDKLRFCLDALRAAGFGLAINAFSIPLGRALAADGRPDEGITLIEETIRQVEGGENLIYIPDLLLAKGELHLATPEPAVGEAEKCFISALEISRNQQALSWELRAATNLARLWQRQGKTGGARDVLAPVYGRFTEGFDTRDLMTASRLLDELT